MLYEFTKLRLEKKEFDNLVFMGEPPWWKDVSKYPPNWDKVKEPDLPMPVGQDFLNSLCYQPLKKVVNKIIDRSGLRRQSSSASEVFEKIKIIARGDSEPWFEQHVDLSKKFDISLMSRIWIRNLAPHEKASPDNSFYVEDGNHRALVYAMLVACDQFNYEPFKAIHATSWDISKLDHSSQHANNLDHQGKLQYDSERYTKSTTKKQSDIRSFIKRPLPIGTQIETYERRKNLFKSRAPLPRSSR